MAGTSPAVTQVVGMKRDRHARPRLGIRSRLKRVRKAACAVNTLSSVVKQYRLYLYQLPLQSLRGSAYLMVFDPSIAPEACHVDDWHRKSFLIRCGR
jgi:hypothetical protein